MYCSHLLSSIFISSSILFASIMEIQGDCDKIPLTLEQLAELFGLCCSVLVFIVLLGMDTMKERKKRAHWDPDNALVLTGLTI